MTNYYQTNDTYLINSRSSLKIRGVSGFIVFFIFLITIPIATSQSPSSDSGLIEKYLTEAKGETVNFTPEKCFIKTQPTNAEVGENTPATDHQLHFSHNKGHFVNASVNLYTTKKSSSPYSLCPGIFSKRIFCQIKKYLKNRLP